MSRLRLTKARLLDVALTAAVGLPVLGSTVAERPEPPFEVPFAFAAVLPLLFRRRRPLLALGVILAAAILAPGPALFEIPLLVMLYTIGTRRPATVTFAAVGAVLIGAALHAATGGDALGEPLAIAIGACGAAGIGRYVGGRRERLEALRERARRLERERELLSERAVAEERVRIAQELHDVVAHNVSLMVVQAQALGATMPEARVVAGTDAIADLGREAMLEMHRTLRLLRAEDDAAGRAPQPGLGDLDALLERARGAGLAVDLTVEGAARPLPQTVDLSAYRIVQEALTNVIKHAPRARSHVRLRYGDDALEVTVIDTGGAAGGDAAPRAGGHGLVGMRERAALFGGTLTAGPADGEGFEVRALLPYGGTP